MSRAAHKLPASYPAMLKDIKSRIRASQIRAALSVNRELIELFGHQIESDLCGRQGKAMTNFPETLPAPQSDLANQLLKDPYHLDFLAVGPDVTERQLEMTLLERLKNFLLELGKGFAFVGNQVHLEVGGKDFYLDLLFYHLHLRCFVVIDLKVEEFKPEFAGKMNFYLGRLSTICDPTESGIQPGWFCG
jgi:predicted nuclease of restriction endonuclease-like (RecB) superfamily